MKKYLSLSIIASIMISLIGLVTSQIYAIQGSTVS